LKLNHEAFRSSGDLPTDRFLSARETITSAALKEEDPALSRRSSRIHLWDPRQAPEPPESVSGLESRPPCCKSLPAIPATS